MRAIIFSWEYPPRIVGQLAEYVTKLAAQLVKNKVETYIVTYHDFLTGLSQEPNGVKTYRVTNPVRTHIGVLTWVLTLNQEVERAAANIYYQVNEQSDLIDVYDWHFIPAAVTLKNALDIPFIFSVESLEEHRAPNADSPYNNAIKGIEGLGFREADKISVKSRWMLKEIVEIHKVPKTKTIVVSQKTSGWVKKVLKTYRATAGGVGNK